MSFPTFVKDPKAKLDYGFDWVTRGWLADGETVTAAVWTVPAGLNLLRSDILENGTVTVCRIGGGSHGADYTISCHITTSEAREDERSMVLKVRNR